MNLTGKDLREFAKEASLQLFSDSTPLVESVTKIAEEHNLNEEQIKRVCHSANTLSQLEVYASEKLANDQEWDVVDPKDIMKNTGKVTKKACKTVSRDYDIDIKAHMRGMVKKAEAVELRDFLTVKTEVLGAQKIASKLSIMSKSAEGEQDICLLKYAGAIDRLAAAITKAKKKGITVSEMLQAAMKTGDAPEVVRKAFNTALEKVKAKEPGLLSRMWSGVTNFFKGAEYQVDPSLINRDMKNFNGGINVEIVDLTNPLVKSFKDTSSSLEELKNAVGRVNTVQEAAENAQVQVKRLEKELRGIESC